MFCTPTPCVAGLRMPVRAYAIALTMLVCKELEKVKKRALGILTLIVAFTTFLWVIFMIIWEAVTPPVNTLANQVAVIQAHFALFILNYANAGLITLLTVALNAGLFDFCRDENSLWAWIAFSFVPIYGLANLVVYLSQIFVVPGLITLYQNPETAGVAEILLRLTIHTRAGSAVGFVNVLAYAILGIPSTILGILMVRKAQGLRIGSGLLAVSGVLSMVALVGVAVKSTVLASTTLLSGAIYLAAIILLGVYFIRQST